jgi:tetratricopeptide (TPR) repeat protein
MLIYTNLSNKLSYVDSEPPRVMPFKQNPRFTGRETELDQLEKMVFTQENASQVAIFGLGGVGKTQLAIELVYRAVNNRSDYMVFWIPATDPESLHQAYLAVAQQLAVPGWNEKDANVKGLVQRYLSQNTTDRWLMIFDNADDIDMWFEPSGAQQEPTRLIDYLPESKRGNVVFTTRDRKLAVKLASQNLIEVTEMNAQHAEELLRISLFHFTLTNDQNHTKVLLEKLAYLPLAIVQATSYINETGCLLSEYVELLDQQEDDIIELLSEDFEDKTRYASIKNPVATTWLISFERIMQQNSLAAKFLSLMACFEPTNIPLSLLPTAPSRKDEIEAIGVLNAYSFVVKRPVERSLDLHRLVHLATRSWLKQKDEFDGIIAQAVTQLSEVFPDDNHENRATWREYLPHALYVLSDDKCKNESGDWMGLAWRVTSCLNSDGRYQECEELFIQILETEKRVLGIEHPDTLTSINNLASTYRNQGRWKEAEELEVQVLETRKRVLGVEHPDTLTSINNLASTYSNQGRWKEAEELKLQVVETRKRVLGVEHPNTLNSMNNLASTYSKQGRWKEAEELEVQVLETRKRVQGVEHPDTLTSMNNLALTYRDQGRWKEAEELKVQVMETRKRVLGVEHPVTLTSINNLAMIWKDCGRDSDALELLEKCADLRKQILGANHPHTLSSFRTVTKWRLEESE